MRIRASVRAPVPSRRPAIVRCARHGVESCQAHPCKELAAARFARALARA